MKTLMGPGVEQVQSMVELAVRAPSVHNTQPWKWTFHDGTVELHADFGRQLHHQDPDARDLIISCGAALHHFRIAARARGWSTLVRRVPDRRRESFLASITFEPMPSVPERDPIADAITARRSDRRHLSCDPLPMGYLDFLTEVAIRQGAMAVPVETDFAKQKVADMLMFAHVVQSADQAGVEDELRWLKDRHFDGVPDSNRLREHTARAPYEAATRFPAGTLDDYAMDPDEPHDPCAQWMIIGTSSDDTMSRLRAGEALSAMLLQGTADRMSVLPLSQAIEVDSTRTRLEEQLFGGALCLQVIMQVGFPGGKHEELPATPRRHVSDVFDALD